ncbi:MAG: AarF/ABC1/UbiB kinase family protein [Alphaproteobacteria bacterium]|nr:AarF/ABC1/UbiB kinase family protein [Alphaproteobacteria bacterium]
MIDHRANLEDLGILPEPRFFSTLQRGVRWGAASGRFMVDVALDHLQGRGTPDQLGKRLRTLFQRVGGTAVKVGQQLAARADLLPQEVCDHLAKLNDDVGPLDSEQARQLVAEGIGLPLDEVFSDFEDEAIGTASVACVYRARLRNGDRVAVKVQRPDVARQFSEDLAAFNLFTRIMEWSTFVRDETFGHLREDLHIMFGEEMDFRLESRYQRQFRKAVRDAGMPWVTAPKVYTQLCTKTVMVTEFVDGIPAGKLVTAAVAEDREALADFAAMDIDPKVLGYRVELFSLWVRFEAPFFHADPHPGNVFIHPGNKLTFLDFGACGMTSRRSRLNHTEVVRLSVKDDPGMVSRVMLSDLSPLPYIDLHEFRLMMEDGFFRVFMAMDDENAHWSERMISGLWLNLLEVARDYQLRMNLDTVRAIRAFLLYDTLAFRLDPQLSMEPLEDFLRDRATRQLKKARAVVEARSPEDHRARQIAFQKESLQRFQQMAVRARLGFEAALGAFEAATNHATQVGIALLRGLYLASLVGLLWTWSRALKVDHSPIVLGFLTHPLTVAAVVAFLGVRLRKAIRSLERIAAQ